MKTDSHQAEADTLIIATGAVAKRLAFKGSGKTAGFWNKGISACAVCDGAAPMFRKVQIAVIGGGDSAMEEALFLTRYGSKVYIIHRRDELRASKIMQKRALDNPKIKVLYSHSTLEAYGNEMGRLAGLKVQDLKSNDIKDLQVNGLFFAIGHEPASKFLKGQMLMATFLRPLVRPKQASMAYMLLGMYRTKSFGRPSLQLEQVVWRL